MHGGKRNGSGRKRGKAGAATTKTRQIADREAASGKVLPLEAMLDAMRAHHAAGRLDEAATVARDAAPYIHPKLTSVQVSGNADSPVPITFIEVVRAPTGGGSDSP